tara:strand:+ start:530 stop:928 length:399 start_codon:yes stop_codon:yes gene_type:complete
MSANNTRVRRIIVEILWEHGPLTKEGVAQILGSEKSIRTVPSPHSLSSLLCKNTQIISVGSEIVESIGGNKSKHLLYDVDRNLVQNLDEVVYSRSPTIMTPKQKREARKCDCGRIRVFRRGDSKCIHCVRSG